MFLFAQFEKDYKPFKYHGNIPDVFFKDPEARAHELAMLEGGENPDAYSFYLEVAHRIQEYLWSGNVYFNDPFTEYANKVAQGLNIEPSLKGQIRIYVMRSPGANAVSLPDGSIFIELGLLSILESEDELAFILAHEIAHVKRKHSLNLSNRMQELQNLEKSAQAGLTRQFLYSREQEFEADALGLEYLLASPYNSSASLSALRSCILADSLIIENPIDYRRYFESEFFDFDSTVNKKRNTISRPFAERSDARLEETTHPDLTKRILALEEMIKSIGAEQSKDTTTGHQIQNLRNQARFEMVGNSYKNGDYYLTLYYSTQMLQEFPGNAYLMLMTLKSLRWIGYFKELHSRDEKNSGIGIKGSGFDEICALLDPLEASEFKRMSYGFLRKNEEELNPAFLYYKALLTEEYLGSGPSRFIYIKYRNEYPQGEYITNVNKKLDR